jgi:hypothetical protein
VVSGALAVVAVLAWAPPAHAQFVVTACQPVEVATLENRIHVRCAAATPGGITFFAIGTKRNADETAFALRSLSLASTAMVSGRGLSIRFDAGSTAGAQIGCLASDCRLIEMIILR